MTTSPVDLHIESLQAANKALAEANTGLRARLTDATAQLATMRQALAPWWEKAKAETCQDCDHPECERMRAIFAPGTQATRLLAERQRYHVALGELAQIGMAMVQQKGVTTEQAYSILLIPWRALNPDFDDNLEQLLAGTDPQTVGMVRMAIGQAPKREQPGDIVAFRRKEAPRD